MIMYKNRPSLDLGLSEHMDFLLFEFILDGRVYAMFAFGFLYCILGAYTILCVSYIVCTERTNFDSRFCR